MLHCLRRRQRTDRGRVRLSCDSRDNDRIGETAAKHRADTSKWRRNRKDDR